MKNRNFIGKIKRVGLNFGDFIEGKGFYIVILLCIFAVGATAAVVSIKDYNKINSGLNANTQFFNNSSKTGADKTIETSKDANTIAKTVTEAVDEQPIKNSAAVKTDKNMDTIAKENTQPNAARAQTQKSIVNVSSAKAEEPRVSKAESVNLQRFSFPVYGKIITKYASDELVFSKTLNEWTTHDGIDISSNLNTPVKAAGDGIIKDIENDPELGITITIEHDNGILTVYSNLSTIAMVNVGEKVKRGKVISGVGNTASFESEDSPHIHFAVIKNGKSVNPEEYLEGK